MNQEKIGKFIAICRKEQNLTQEQLATKLGISAKAISKWETGKGLPDVSLFKPLCKQLNITLNELFAGEKITEEEIVKKSEETLINLAKEKQKSKFSIWRIIGISLLVIVTFSYIFYKTMLLEQYYSSKKLLDEDFHVARLYKNYNERKYIEIKKSNESYNKGYISISGLNIRNDFQDYEKTSQNVFNNEITLIKKNKTETDMINHFSITTDDQTTNYTKYIKKLIEKIHEHNFLERLLEYSYDLTDDFKKYNINNDIDLYAYLLSNYDNEVHTLSLINTIRKQVTIYGISHIFFRNFSRMEVITGDYDGYILYSISYNNINAYDIFLKHNDNDYLISLMGDEFTDEYIHELISTITFDSEIN